ncbi:hypothetical protein NRK68_34025 (plasmid) [Streptomyces yangpuensis]|uniref:Peptidase inhibitor family I36 n=1 Tax=Streptomyces yangpuensis TaxID=1648182 RepID=A0ABY5Q7Z6_9ACTN|nr:hypothetical protein [Streptomyces yangpuensis]UUY52300.1 hypothetical protein NRK68_34025 [Streptomyces yangpuensis]
MRAAKSVAISMMAGIILAASAPAAWADLSEEQQEYANSSNNLACGIPQESTFKFAIYFNSGQAGSWRMIGYNVYDMEWVRYQPNRSAALKFCGGGVGTPPAGYGQKIKNNAATGDNWHYKYWANVHFNRGYSGPKDSLAPYNDALYQFAYVYNENASFSWS